MAGANPAGRCLLHNIRIGCNRMTVRTIFLLLSLVASPVAGLGQKACEPEPLPPGRLPARRLKGGEAHCFRIRLKAGEYFRVEVGQAGVDVMLLLSDRDGKVVVERDRPNGDSGQESLSFIAAAGGDYRLDVKAVDENAGAGNYELYSERLRRPGEQEEKRVAAEKLFQEGRLLSKVPTVESVTKACEKYDSAALLWRGLGDRYAEALTLTSLGFCRQSVKEYEKAISAHERASALSRELGLKEFEALNLRRLCILNVAGREMEAAFKQCRAARAIYRAAKDAAGEKELDAQLRAAAESYMEIVSKLDQQAGARAYPAQMALLGIVRDIYVELGDKNKEAITLLAMGRMTSSADRKRDALGYYDRALPLFEGAGNKVGMAMTFNNIGAAHSALGDKRAALEYYERRALPLYREIEGKEGVAGVAETLSKIGVVSDHLGDRQRALDCLAQALPLFREVGDKAGEAGALHNIGTVYGHMGDKAKALDYLKNQALPLRREARDEIGEAITLLNIGSVYLDLGYRARALDYYERQALPIYRKLGLKSREAAALNNIGRVYDEMGDRTKALDYYEKQALPRFRQAEDRSGMATTFLNIGGIYGSIGEADRALDYYEKRALPLFEEVGEKTGVATTLNNIGILYSRLGDKQKALDYYERRALPLQEEAGDLAGQAATLNNIGRVYDYLGERRKALEYFEKKALPLYLKVKDPEGVGVTLNNIGGVREALGDTRGALDYYEKMALPLYRELGDKAGLAATLNNIGQAYSSLGDKRRALDYYENRVLPLRREAGDKQGEAVTLNNIGSAYFALGDKRKALEFFGRALPLDRAAGDKENEGRTLSNMMLAWNELKNPRLAVFYGKLCVNAYQQIRFKNRAVEREFQKTLLRSVEDFYRYLAALLVEQGRLAEAVQILNAFKDERDFDFNLETAREPSPVEPTAREGEAGARYAKAADKIGGLIKQIEGLKLVSGDAPSDAGQAAELRRLESDLKAAEEEFAAVLRQAEAEFGRPPDPAKDAEPRVAELGEMRKTLKSLSDGRGGKTVVIYTLVGENNFYALAVTPDAPRAVVAASAPVRGARLNDKARQLWALLQSDEYDPRALSEELYTLVFQPIKDGLRREGGAELALPEGATILWSLDGNLRYLPMAALYDGEKYLAERYHNVVFTRADVKQWTRAGAARWTGVGFGNSQAASVAQDPYEFKPLPNAIRELRAVFNTRDSKAGVFDGLIFPDSAFTRDAMTAALKERRPLVHIASHFYFSPGDSTRSYLVLGDRRVFTLNEMKSEVDFTGVELLTLSACETAAQWANADGREVDGFAELAQRLGAGAVLATLWNVRDDSSYWLMREFYQSKQGAGGETKAGALRQAQLALLSGAAKVPPPPAGASGGGRNSTAVKILPAGKATRPRREEGVVYVEAKYAVPYVRSRVRPYAHPYFWSPFVLFGNWR